jgi:hypothetical protein
MNCPELLNPKVVQEGVVASGKGRDLERSLPWGEEECSNVVAFFTLLDQWDRDLNAKKQVA